MKYSLQKTNERKPEHSGFFARADKSGTKDKKACLSIDRRTRLAREIFHVPFGILWMFLSHRGKVCLEYDQ